MNKQFFNRNASTILVKPCYEGRPYPCYETGFDATTRCPRVIRLENMRQGIEESTPDQFYDLRGKQPVFYLQEMYGPDGRWQWNGRLLYSVGDAQRARKVLSENADRLKVLLGFEDPDTHCYYFLVETGVRNLSNESFLITRSSMDIELKQLFCRTYHYDLNFYVRALPEHCYDIIDRDALFGPSLSLGEAIRAFFGNIFPFANH